jgi:hypothetical protein
MNAQYISDKSLRIHMIVFMILGIASWCMVSVNLTFIIVALLINATQVLLYIEAKYRNDIYKRIKK